MSNTHRPSAPVKHTVVEEGTEFKGALTSSCPIDVRGRIEGDVSTPSLSVSATGAVHGRAKVGAVRSEGELSGEFDADSVELAGTVRDNTVIRARSLEVKLAANRGKLQVIFGECELSVGEQPTEQTAVDAEPAAADPAAAEAMEAVAAAEQPAAEQAAALSAEEESEDEEAADDSGAEAGDGGKRRRKRKNGQPQEVTTGGWSQPPSQPPPAS